MTDVPSSAVIARLSQQIGTMAAEVAMLQVALEQAHARIRELENPGEATP